MFNFLPVLPSAASQKNDWEEGSTALGHHLIDFWTNICLCQSLILEKNPMGGPDLYQVSTCVLFGDTRWLDMQAVVMAYVR